MLMAEPVMNEAMEMAGMKSTMKLRGQSYRSGRDAPEAEEADRKDERAGEDGDGAADGLRAGDGVVLRVLRLRLDDDVADERGKNGDRADGDAGGSMRFRR